MEKGFVESFLRLNGIGPHASESEVSAALAEARWPKEQIEEALLVRSGDGAAKKRLAEKRSGPAFRPDLPWSSAKISSLLGIDVILDPKTFRMSVEKEAILAHTGRKVLLGLCTAIVALAIAAGIGVTIMYFLEVGPFHTQAQDII